MLALASLLLYSFFIVTMMFDYKEQLDNVSRFLRHYILVNFLLAVDILLTIFVPFIVIFLINVLISYRLLYASCYPGATTVRQSSCNIHLTPEVNSFMSDHNQEAPNAARHQDPLLIDNQQRSGVGQSRSRAISASMGSSIRKTRTRTYLKMTRKLLMITTAFLILNAPLVYLDFENLPNYIGVFIEELAFLISPTRFPSALITNTNSSGLAYEDGYDPEVAYNATRLIEEAEMLRHQRRQDCTLIDVLRFCSYPLYYLNFSINFMIYAFKPKMFAAS